MPNPTPLNPDALRDAILFVSDFCQIDTDNAEPIAQRAVTAYLEAVAQPVVNSVEELDKLPVGTVIQSGEYPERRKFGLYRKFSKESWLFSEDYDFRGLSITLPARVLYRPEVNDLE